MINFDNFFTSKLIFDWDFKFYGIFSEFNYVNFKILIFLLWAEPDPPWIQINDFLAENTQFARPPVK